ncbi:MAG: UDP-2,4-diacetamido-2,4,6-trideoxy-beta-L-altropyranose hydrolase, partial [Terracidiphilus sp.]
GIGRMWETQMRPYVRSIAVIDDLADREHECDVLIDANFHPDSVNRYADKLPAHCVQLLGPKYALLRGEFLQERAHLQNRTGLVRRIQAQRVQAQRMLAQPILAQRIQIQRILVFFGGVDLSNQTLKALGAIASLDRREIATDVVVGATNPHRGSVQEFCATHPDFAFHCQTAEMAMLMGQADLAIGAGGTTMWERCAMGLPSLVVTVAENQVPSTAAMACEGLLRYLGSSTEVSQSMIAHALLGLLENHDEAMRMPTSSPPPWPAIVNCCSWEWNPKGFSMWPERAPRCAGLAGRTGRRSRCCRSSSRGRCNTSCSRSCKKGSKNSSVMGPHSHRYS